MLSIGAVAKAAKISSRTLRHYESLGLIEAKVRGDNNYRYFEKSVLERVRHIRDLQSLGFSLEEIRVILELGTASITESLERRLAEVGEELKELSHRRDRLVHLLSISQRVESLHDIPQDEREIYMEMLKEDIVNGLRARKVNVRDTHIHYIEREQMLSETPEKKRFIEALKECIAFAKQHRLTLGPGRGSSPASVTLYSLGFHAVDPTDFDLIPERLMSQPPDIHIDVEFEKGQDFIDFCRKTSESLSWGQINAFKMPLLDVIRNVQTKLSHPIDFSRYSDDSSDVLNPIQTGDIEKIFGLDYSPGSQIMKFENFLPGYAGPHKIKEYLLSQKVQSFRDIINIYALWHPTSAERLERLNLYKEAKLGLRTYQFLAPELQVSLEKNFGMVLYHEDLIRIMSHYSGWDFERCNRLRRALFMNHIAADEKEFQSLVSEEVWNLFRTEVKQTFDLAHSVSFCQFTKWTAVLKSLHRDLYLSEVALWEDKHGLAYDDIGIKIPGVSLLQH